MFVPTLVIVTVAFGTTAPVGSVIVPVMTPCTVCDQTAPALARTSKAATKKTKVRSLILSPPYNGLSAKALNMILKFGLSKETRSTPTTLLARNIAQTSTIGGIQLLIGRLVKCNFELSLRRSLDAFDARKIGRASCRE